MTLDAILDMNLGKHDAKLYFDLRHALQIWGGAQRRKERERCAKYAEQPGADGVVFFVRQQVAMEIRSMPDESEATE